MNTLFGEIDGEGSDTAVEGRTVLAVAVRRSVRKYRAKEAAQALPQAPEVPTSEVRSGIQAMVDRGDTEAWHGLINSYWLIGPHGCFAVCCEWAAGYFDDGRVIVLGTWAAAAAVRVGMGGDA